MEISTTALALTGTKRAAPTEESVKVKRARIVQEPESSDNTESDTSDQESVSDKPATTPLTSFSGKSPPRIHPCRINHLPCTYPDCPKTFNRPARLEEHLRSHTNTRPFVCPHVSCIKDFLRDSHLKRHIQSAHTNERSYVCKYEECEKTFVTGSRLRRHYIAHEGRDKYRCTETGCGQSFRKHGTLQRHKLTVHEGKDAFTCEVIEENGKMCGQGFSNAYKLKLHQGRHHNTQRYWCSVCKEPASEAGETVELGFSTYGDFQAHNRVIHPPTCEQCGIKRGSIRELKQHMELKHSGQTLADRRKFPCPEPDCDHVFVKQSSIAVHIRSVHEKQKPFVCNECDPSELNNVHGWDGSGACHRSYAVKASLEEHVRTAHLGFDYTKKAKEKKVGISKPANPRPTSKTTTLGLLTGTAYDENPDRKIPCLMLGCQYVYTREYDLNLHLQTWHRLDENEISRLRAMQLARTSHQELGNGMDVELDGVFDEPMEEICGNQSTFGEENWETNFDNSATTGGPFWIGGDDGSYNGYDNVFVEEADMRMLTDGALDLEMIDPSLYQH